MNVKLMKNFRLFSIWCWWLLVLIPNIKANSKEAHFMSFCNQTLNFSSSSLLIQYKPFVYSSCCNITLVRSPPLSDLSEQITINILNMSTINPSLFLFNKQVELIKFYNYLSLNRTYLKSDIVHLPISLSLCRFDIQSFDILITNISRGPCKLNQYRCLTTDKNEWCVDETYHCDGYHSCPQGMDEYGCTKSITKLPSQKPERTIRGSIVTTITILGLLLIIGSVSIALIFVYIRRKRLRERQFDYSFESNSDEWEPSGTGYHLFSNSTNNRRHTRNNVDNLIIDANEHIPIRTTMTNNR